MDKEEIKKILINTCHLSRYKIGLKYLVDIIYLIICNEGYIEKITFYVSVLAKAYNKTEQSISRALDNIVRDQKNLFSKSIKRFLIDIIDLIESNNFKENIG